jgi:uncharacterized protein YcfJ
MTKFHMLGVAALAFMMLAPDATAQVVGGAARGGVRGAVVGGLVGGESGRETGARIGAVAGAARTVGNEVQARAQYQATPAYQSAPRSDFSVAPPQVLPTSAPTTATAAPTAATAAPAAATTAPAAATTAGGEAVLRKPIIGVTFPSDWRMVTGDRYISAVSRDGQAYGMIAILEGATDKPEGITRVKQMLPHYLHDIKFDDQTETKRGATVVTGTANGNKTGVNVVFAVGVMDAGAGQMVGAAFVVDAGIEDHYKETIRQICQTIRLGDQLTEKK